MNVVSTRSNGSAPAGMDRAPRQEETAVRRAGPWLAFLLLWLASLGLLVIGTSVALTIAS